MTVLIVDDSSIMRKIIRGSVELLGYDFVEASNGVEALAVMEKQGNGIHLILMDVNMPEKDGLTALEELKSDDRFKDIPVMMITTESERTTVVRALQLGAKHYVNKPFTQEDLATKMMQCLEVGVI